MGILRKTWLVRDIRVVEWLYDIRDTDNFAGLNFTRRKRIG